MTSLIARLTEGEGFDYILNEDIAAHFKFEWRTWPPKLTTSLDACIALAERVLPDIHWCKFNGRSKVVVTLYNLENGGKGRSGAHSDVCRAFLIALITAKEASHDTA